VLKNKGAENVSLSVKEFITISVHDISKRGKITNPSSITSTEITIKEEKS